MTVTLRRLVFSRLSIWVVLTVLGGWFLYNIRSNIKFGIDLVGGTYITLDVQVEKAYENALVDLMNGISTILPAQISTAITAKEVKNESLRLIFSSLTACINASETIAQQMRGQWEVEVDGQTLTLRLSKARKEYIAREALKSNINALTNRLNRFGVSEIIVAQHGARRIVIELPNVHNIQQARETIGRVANLEFKLVEDQAASEEILLERYGGVVPDGMIIVPGEMRHEQNYESAMYYLVSKYATVSGRDLEAARSAISKDDAKPTVEINFKPDAARRFYELTTNIGQPIAIILDGVVISAPVAQNPIPGGSAVISGRFTAEDSRQLAMLLSSGAFAAPVTFEEERHIGPSLGEAAIHQGVMAFAIGGLLLLLFCLIAYKTAGLVAFIVLLYNIIFSLVLLSLMGATLTLPGIAGILLTIGVAVDASVLIYERIREELFKGSPLRRAIDAGFSGSMAVILDSNITGFLVAVVLYTFASGPIRGFAATQMVGIVATLITGLWLLKSLLTYLTDVLNIGKIKF